MTTNNDRCRVCNDPRTTDIEAELMAGTSMRTVANAFGVSRDSIMRHFQRHMPNVQPRLVIVRHERIPQPDPEPDLKALDPEPEPQPEPEPELPKTLEERKSVFIDVLADTGSQHKSMHAAGINWFELRRWHEGDEEFTFKFNLAVAHAKDALIDVARDRAIHGTKQVLQIYRRQLLIEERVEYKPSDSALLALLKAFHPELFGDKLTVTQTTVVKAIDAMAWEAV